MKKFLLFAAAAIVAVSANAQSLKKGLSGKPNTAKTVAKGEMKSIFGKELTSVRSSAATLTMKGKSFNQNVTSLKAVNQLKNTTAVRRAGEIQERYNGMGTNYKTKEAASWTMFSGTDKESGKTLLADVIPLPDKWSSLGNIAVEYSISGSTITIAPQCVVTGQAQDESTIYYFLHSWASNDGSIVLTLGEDGSLTTIDGEDIAYSAFSENTFDLSEGGPYMGLVLDIEKVKYLMEGQAIIPVAGYQPQTLFLHVSPNVNGNYYTNLMIPAFADIELANRTDVACDSYLWTLQKLTYNGSAMVEDGDPIIGTDKDFTFFSGESSFSPASLVSTLNGQSSEEFTWNKSTWYAGMSADSWDDEGKPTCTFSKANPSGDLTIINPTGTKSIIFYQGKPASALYFTGVNMFIYQFEQAAGKNLGLICKLHKAHRDPETGRFSLGELIAQADVDEENIERGDWMSAQNLVRLHWNNFYREDEEGLTEDVPYLLLDEEFAVVIEGWDQGTFSGSPLVFTSVCDGGFSNTYAILPSQETYEGAGWSGTFDAIVGFEDAVYGFLYTEDSKNISIPDEGGEASITVHPMYSNGDEAAAEQGYKTRLFLDETVTDNKIPEWLSVGFANEDYDENYTFDLVFSADALPAGVEGRQVTLVFWQEGAKLEVTVTQGNATGVNVTTKTVKNVETPAYNLAGQRVNKDFKGLVVKDGAKFLNK